jgi:hypothetical protein
MPKIAAETCAGFYMQRMLYFFLIWYFRAETAGVPENDISLVTRRVKVGAPALLSVNVKGVQQVPVTYNSQVGALCTSKS